ncbi:MAG TPA: hypothetical protein ENJ11_09415 [Gammaproteobacteria bacterium]|nr:hypothetical protein [Gammaproteobacteria bacterium]
MLNAEQVIVRAAGRLFHWSLVRAFSVARITGEEDDLHICAGYVILGLLAFSLISGYKKGE